MAFGKALRKSIETDPNQFDRVKILSQTHEPLVDATKDVLRAFKSKK